MTGARVDLSKAGLSPKEAQSRGAPRRCDEPHPWTTSSCLGRHLLLWFWPMLADGMKRPLMKQDVWPLPVAMNAATLLPRFDAALREARRSFPGALRRLVRKRLALLWCVQYLMAANGIAMPFLIILMISFLRDPDAPTWQGLLIALGGFVFALIQANGAAFVHRNAIGKGCELRLQTMLVIFRKALALRSWGCGEGVVSNLLTGMSVDCERIYFMMHMGQWINFNPFIFFLCTVMLWYFAGWFAGTAGIAMLLLLLLLTAKVGDVQMCFRRLMQVNSSRRMLLTRQALDGIRAIKMYGWVEPLEERICVSRRLEEIDLGKYLRMRAVSTSLAYIVPSLMNTVVFTVAVLTGEVLSVDSFFVVIALVNFMRAPMSGFPIVVGYLTDGFVSVSRVAKLLALPERAAEESSGEAGQPEKAAWPVVLADAADFSWHSPGGAEDAQQGGVEVTGLREVSLQIAPGELCCVVGPVGGGKSSLVSAVLGDMAHEAGSCTLRAPSGVAYCPQEPWILSTEIWKNVALGCDSRAEVDADAYTRAVASAELDADLALLPAGDETEIGAHGINLSGGQRARVALARAVYQTEVRGCELVILDDVLSAVDLGVARRLVSNCVLGKVLRDRARIVVLNSHYELLDHADKVVVVAGGRVEVYDSVAAYQGSRWAAALLESAAGKGSSEASSAATALAEVPAWIAAGLPKDLNLAGSDSATAQRSMALSVSNPALSDDEALGALDLSGKLLVPEDRQVGLLSLSTYKLYFGHVAACGCGYGFFALVLFLIVVTEVLRIFSDIWLAEWAEDIAETGGEDEEQMRWWMWSYMALSAVTVGMCFLRSFVFMAFAQRTSRSVHRRMIARALRAPVNTYFDTVPTPQILNRLGKDLDVVDTMLPHYLLEFFQDWTFLLCTFAIVVWKAPLVLCAVPFCGYGFLRIRVAYMASSRELKRMEAVSRSPLLAALTEVLEGLSTIRALRLEGIFSERFRALVEENGTMFWHTFMLLPWMISRIDSTGALFVLAAAVSLTVLRGDGGHVQGALAFTYVLNFVCKLQWSVRQSIEAENYLTSVERCEHFERIGQELEPRGAGAVAADALARAAAGHQVPAVEFRNVSVRYRPRLPLAIQDLSFAVQPGERVGVIGRTGCGKSTLALCLFRLLEVEHTGEVRVHGFDVRRLATTALRRAISAVPQVPLVYAGTLRENLDPLGELTDARLCEALSSVGLSSFAAGGLDFALSEGGANMSAGQRQLLTIARASLRKAHVVVCDEATSSCDPKTDAAVQQLLQGGTPDGAPSTAAPFAGAAMITVAHRLDTLATYDRVLLLSAPSGGFGTGIREIRRETRAEVPGRAASPSSKLSL